MKPGNLELFATTMVKKKKKSMRRNPTKRNEEKLGPSLRISFKDIISGTPDVRSLPVLFR